MLKNYRLSDDIAFRFSTGLGGVAPQRREVRDVGEPDQRRRVPLQPVHGLRDLRRAPVGRHRHLRVPRRELPEAIFDIKKPPGENHFITPVRGADRFDPVGEYDVPSMISWADTERDLTAWLGNAMQWNALDELYRLEDEPRIRRGPTGDAARRAPPARGLAQAHHLRPLLLHVHQVLGRRRRPQVLQPLRLALRRLHQLHERARQPPP
jgi:alpha-amylase/alpha-mannosidase (GH57 family)